MCLGFCTSQNIVKIIYLKNGKYRKVYIKITFKILQSRDRVNIVCVFVCVFLNNPYSFQNFHELQK